MGDFKAFTRDRVDVVAVELVGGSKANRVNETIERWPYFYQLAEQRFNARVFRHVARQHNVRVQRGGEIFHAAFQFVVLIRERQFGPFAVHRLGNAVGDGQFAGDAGNQDTFAGKKTHSVIILLLMVIAAISGLYARHRRSAPRQSDRQSAVWLNRAAGRPARRRCCRARPLPPGASPAPGR